jgi:hypothetical protein
LLRGPDATPNVVSVLPQFAMFACAILSTGRNSSSLWPALFPLEALVRRRTGRILKSEPEVIPYRRFGTWTADGPRDLQCFEQ